MVNALAAQPPAVELILPLAPGSIVRLPDDSIAEVTTSTHSEVSVVHAYLAAAGMAGAGPWSYERLEVEDASELEQLAYRRAVRGATARMGWFGGRS